MKPGWLTSEAHLAAFAQFLAATMTMAGSFQGDAPAGVRIALIVVGAISSVMTALGYGKQRSELKAALPPFYQAVKP